LSILAGIRFRRSAWKIVYQIPPVPGTIKGKPSLPEGRVATNRTQGGMAQLVLALRMHEAEGQSDGQLLRRFLAERDEAAFAALVRRHGPMVLSVCRRVLGNAADAEDAFQATFLVLVRKAHALRWRSVLGDWLHGVARRTAWKAKGAAAHRWIKEQAMARPEAQGDQTRDDWLPLLDEELGCLPEKYRLPVVLCDLEGRTRQEAAAQLGWPEGTVAGRLARARTMLSKRLARRGVVLSGAALSALLPAKSPACVPTPLLSTTTRAAILVAAGNAAADGAISAKVAALTREVMKAMLLSKLKSVAVVLIVCVLSGFGWMGYCSLAGESGGANNAAERISPAPKVPEKKPADANDPIAKAVADDVRPPDPRPATTRELLTGLREPMDMSKFAQQMTFKDFLGLMGDIYASQRKNFPILVDTQAFLDENPESEVLDTAIKFHPLITSNRALNADTVLRFAIGQIPNSKAELLLRDGNVWITTQKRASVSYLLQERFVANFYSQPLTEVVQYLSDLTGVSIALDPRVEEKAKTRITVLFRNDVNLWTALRIVADMAGLKVVDMQSGVYITTPANARELEKELREAKK
jgi:RNA polymerase sigma factor (sigma-70 family)